MTRGRLLVVGVAALASKGLVLAALHDHPLLQPTGGLDGGVYVALGRRVAAGDLALGPEPFFVSPLYAYFLGLVFAVTGGSLLAAQLVQIVLGTLGAMLVAKTAERLFGERAALPAGLLAAAASLLAFHESLILQAALDPFLTALALFSLVSASDGAAPPRGDLRRFLGAGLALGLLALNRPNVLPWAGVVALLLVATRGRKAGLRPATAYLLGAALAIAPATLRNLAVAHEPIPISSHGGLNFLIGNAPEADGTYRWLDGITPSIEGQARDARKVAERETGRTLSAREVSAHFAAKGWRWIAAEPKAAARLFAKKLRLVFAEGEAPLNFSVPWYRRETPVLRALFVGPAVLLPFAAIGLALARPRKEARRAPFVLWLSFVPAYAVLVAAFFVSTRYRLPLLVALAPAAGAGLVRLLDALRAREIRALALAAAVALPALALALWPTGLDDGRSEEETQWVLHLVSARRVDAAERRLAPLLASHAEPPLVRFRVGQAFLAIGETSRAIRELEAALAARPGMREIEIALSRSLLAEGRAALDARDAEKARAPLARAAGLDPENGETRLANGLALALLGRAAEAEPELRAAVRLLDASAPARLNLAAVLAELGRRDEARRLAREALALQPAYPQAEALLRDLGPK